MNLEEIITHLERDRAAHTTSGPSDEAELQALEDALGQSLPAALRTFLARVGGGIFYSRHEIFGGHRVVIHDIELVPSLRTMVGVVRASRPSPPEGWLPFHRADGVLHLIDSPGRQVISWPPGSRHPGLVDFLATVVLGARPASAG